MTDFSIESFGQRMFVLRNEIKRGKSLNSMIVRETVLYLVDFAASPEYDEMMFAAREARAAKLYERTTKK
jgi:hypothetical protein